MSTSHLLTVPTSCRSFQPYSPNFSHPGLLSILWLCQTLSHFRDFARVVLLLRTVSLLPVLQKAGSFPSSHVSSNVNSLGENFCSPSCESSPNYTLHSIPPVCICICCLCLLFSVLIPTRIKVHKDKEFAWCRLSMHSQSLGLAHSSCPINIC